MPRTPRNRWLRPELLLLIASIVVSVLLAEALLRIYYSVTYTGTLEDLNSKLPPPGVEAHFGDMVTLSAYPRLVYQFKPGLDVLWKDASVRTNAQGFRESSEPAPREPGTIRVLGIGDSVMFGLGVEENERYMDVLEVELNQDFPAATWETMALAIPGYNLVAEVEVLKRFGLEYDPDLVIYGFVSNDFCLPNFVSRRLSVWSFESFLGYYWKRGAPTALIRRKDVTLEDHEDSPAELSRENFREQYCDDENVLPEYRHLAGENSFYEALDELARIGRQRGIPTVFLSYGRDRRGGKIPRPDGMHLVDLNPLYEKYLKENGYRHAKDSDLVLSTEDLHPSVKGHRMIGAALAERLVEMGLVEEMLARRGLGDS